MIEMSNSTNNTVNNNDVVVITVNDNVPGLVINNRVFTNKKIGTSLDQEPYLRTTHINKDGANTIFEACVMCCGFICILALVIPFMFADLYFGFNNNHV